MADTRQITERGVSIGPAERKLLQELRRALMTIASAIGAYLDDSKT